MTKRLYWAVYDHQEDIRMVAGSLEVCLSFIWNNQERVCLVRGGSEWVFDRFTLEALSNKTEGLQ